MPPKGSKGSKKPKSSQQSQQSSSQSVSLPQAAKEVCDEIEKAKKRNVPIPYGFLPKCPTHSLTRSTGPRRHSSHSRKLCENKEKITTTSVSESLGSSSRLWTTKEMIFAVVWTPRSSLPLSRHSYNQHPLEMVSAVFKCLEYGDLY